jgi:hypothetical protein
MDASEMGRLGGKARAERLTPEQRKQIASKGGKASAKKKRQLKRLKKQKKEIKE